MYISGFFSFRSHSLPSNIQILPFYTTNNNVMKQKQLNNQIHYINLLYICKQQMMSGTKNRNNIEIFLYS